MNKHVVVIGGGVAGMEAAGSLAEAGVVVTLIEKGQDPGGHLLKWHALFPDRRPADEVRGYLRKRIEHENINVITNTIVEKISHHGHDVVVNLAGGTEERADAVIVATGFDLFDARRKEEYGYGIYDNVITSADLEEMFNRGKVCKTDGSVPARIGFVHCVGSRDEKVSNNHCSKVCCVSAVKQAIEVRKILPECEIFCFYMDMRMFGPYYEELYRESQEVHNVNYVRGKVSEASVNIKNRLVIKVEDTLAARPLKMELDMMVLMVGMEMSKTGKRLAEASGLGTGINRFLETGDHHYGNNLSQVKGVFYAGTCTAPMNITDTISHARAAVTATVRYLNGR
ncbi:CoB--CoM heterodisulfide reductase iron-sulfur subunit A family protein [bacterium]|nr:CoB--CoM heterodisulfide reductase iron-sulfur subunit A family protein [bacterium]